RRQPRVVRQPGVPVPRRDRLGRHRAELHLTIRGTRARPTEVFVSSVATVRDRTVPSPGRWRWLPAAVLVPALVTLGLPDAGAQTTAPPPPGGDPTIVAAGDIATCNDTGDEGTAALVDSMPGTVLPLGDLAYQDGSKADFDNCYGPTWGRFKDRSRPTTGNHEYVQNGAGPYFDYWGAGVGERGKGYYSFDVGTWHLIALNSTCGAVGGCARNTPMEQWLKADLAATKAHCILAFWHRP